MVVKLPVDRLVVMVTKPVEGGCCDAEEEMVVVAVKEPVVEATMLLVLEALMVIAVEELLEGNVVEAAGSVVVEVEVEVAPVDGEPLLVVDDTVVDVEAVALMRIVLDNVLTVLVDVDVKLLVAVNDRVVLVVKVELEVETESVHTLSRWPAPQYSRSDPEHTILH